MTEPAYSLEDLGDRRVLTVGGREYSTAYSARVVRMLVEGKGPVRAPQDFSFKENWSREINWGTHDFVIRVLCRHDGLARPLITGYWFPSMSRLVPDPAARFRLESRAGRLPVLRHAAGALAVETRRTGAAPR